MRRDHFPRVVGADGDNAPLVGVELQIAVHQPRRVAPQVVDGIGFRDLDLRGLAFCCPPVKHCAVLGALKKAGMTPEEFVARKLALARGTPLEKGEGTCFGSLVWCCKASKMCYLREAAMQKIGLSDREYMELKKKLAEDLLRPSG